MSDNHPIQVRRPNNAGYELFTQAWSKLNKKIEDQLNSLAKNIFTDLDSFIRDTHKQWLSMEFEESQNCRSKYRYRQVPTAVVVAGVNTPDHRLIYDQLRLSVLKNHGRVAIIHSGSIISSARALVSESVSQLISGGCLSESLVPSRDNSSQIHIQVNGMGNVLLSVHCSSIVVMSSRSVAIVNRAISSITTNQYQLGF
ncbi:hypothetical protein FBUS_11748 [Fasciolopsis buskii]|uniref:Origin recognition complex subunit 3 N-terminal domain-containing protein n=1 Tax=Fasciolopsis buskii TaxID=27845 RepID=A0A8E0VK53_9TREM|nr:hypothetical protein FBUS_11748 [Fasciolopsis buski]